MLSRYLVSDMPAPRGDKYMCINRRMHVRCKEIAPPRTHPYVVTMTIDPVEIGRWRRMAEGSPEFRFLDHDDSEPDHALPSPNFYWIDEIGRAHV